MTNTATHPSPDDLLALAVEVATEAARLARQRQREGVAVADTKSSAVDVVTAADREVEDLIRGRLSAARPDDGFLGEETGTADGTSGLTWIVDPIDGTVNYLYGIPASAVSIAVGLGTPGDDPAHPERTLAGVVVDITTGAVHAATRGGGATLDGRPLAVNQPESLGLSLVATGFGYRADVRQRQAAVMTHLAGEVRDFRRLGSAALDLCGVADGRVDAYYERGINPWDYAAGALIAAEAGARFEMWELGDGDRPLAVIAGEAIVDELSARVRAAIAAVGGPPAG